MTLRASSLLDAFFFSFPLGSLTLHIYYQCSGTMESCYPIIQSTEEKRLITETCVSEYNLTRPQICKGWSRNVPLTRRASVSRLLMMAKHAFVIVYYGKSPTVDNKELELNPSINLKWRTDRTSVRLPQFRHALQRKDFYVLWKGI